MDPMYQNPGEGYNPNQNTFVLMWNPAFSSVTMDYHLYCIKHFDEEPFDWSVYEWEKAHTGDRFYLVRVGEGKTGIVMSGVFTSEPYVADDWNKSRGSKQIHYMDMRPNFIVNPEAMPIVTTAQLMDAIPDFEWRKGHSGTLLSDAQARKLEGLFAQYLHSVKDKVDGEELVIVGVDETDLIVISICKEAISKLSCLLPSLQMNNFQRSVHGRFMQMLFADLATK